jgi:hypothetical protein
MRVALCISGYFRGLKTSLPTWTKHLFNKDLTIDTFIHTGPNLDIHAHGGIGFEKDLLNKEIKPIEIVIENKSHFTNSSLVQQRNTNKRSIDNLFSMYYRIKRCNELKMKYEQNNGFTYDCVIRFRPDIYLRQDVIIDSTTDLSKWNVPKYGDFTGLNDQIAWSSSANMNYYSNAFDYLEKYLIEDPNLIFNPELHLKRHWEKSGCDIHRPEILYNLSRRYGLLPDNKTREQG